MEIDTNKFMALIAKNFKSSEDFAKKAKISRATLSRIKKNGEISKIETINKISVALNIDPVDLCKEMN